MKAMKNTSRTMKVLLLMALLTVCLLLTGCVVPPDDIDTSGDYVVGNGNLPFQNVAPVTQKITEASTHTPAPVQPQPSEDLWNWSRPQETAPQATGNTGSSIIPPNQGALVGTITVPTINVEPSTTDSAQSATSSTLKHGSTGSEVRKMQQRLKELGYLKGSVDGDFGDATETAVKAFQQQHGLTVDGKAGTRTLDKLYSSSALKAPSATQRVTATPTPRATATPNLSRDYYLEVGSSGSKVRVLQNRLIELGWLVGKANGEYKEATAYAVRAFQDRYSSLDTDGVAGPGTLKILYSEDAATSKEPVASIGTTMQLGSESDAVKAMQKRLKELGFLSGKADGDFGEATKAAVIAFQTANGLAADGRAGSGTLNKLYSEKAKASASLKPTPTKKPTASEEDEDEDDVIVNGYYVLKEGSKGDEVKKLQRALKNRGYFSSSITGYYGEVTAAAVMAFQQRNGLTADGVAGPATQNLLYNTQSSSAYETLKRGDKGTAVKNMQYVLKELGYFDDSVNGTYGPATEAAVLEFQIRNDLSPADGVAGNKTLQRLYSDKAIAASAETTTYTELEKGDKGDLVVQLQEQLAVLGYLSEPTAYFDSATVEAVKNFQRRNGLTVNGKATQEVLRLLYTGKPKTAY